MVKGSDILLIIVAIIFPPVAVGFIHGCSCELLLNIVLTLIGYFPGLIYAFMLIYYKMRAEEAWRYERLGDERGYGSTL